MSSSCLNGKSQEPAVQYDRLRAGEECLQAALECHRRGWPAVALCPPDHIGIRLVNPKHSLKCKSQGKAPWNTWGEYQTRLPTEAEIREAWRRLENSNVGVILGHVGGIIRVDVEGEGGNAKLRELCKGEPPKTLAFTSGQPGSLGLLFKIPPGIELQTKREGFAVGEHDELRLQGPGSLTVIPPSWHKEGTQYQWLPGCSPDEIEAALMPAWAVEMMRVQPRAPGKPRPANGSATTEDRATALAALAALKPERAASYDSWLHVGMALHSVADDDEMLEVWDEWSKQCEELYEEEACAWKWATFDRDKEKGHTLGSLIYWAKQDGWIRPRGPRVRLSSSAAQSSLTETAQSNTLRVTDDGEIIDDDPEKGDAWEPSQESTAPATTDSVSEGAARKSSRATPLDLITDAKGTSPTEENAPPKANTPPAPPPEPFHLTDLGNAKRAVARHGVDWRYCHPLRAHFIFDGSRWREDNTGEATRLVKETQASLYQWAAQRIAALGALADEDERKSELPALMKVLKHCLQWESVQRIAACLTLATTEPGVPILPADLDRDPWLLNVQNGTIDLRTGKLREHRRQDLMTKIAPVTFDANARCPLWERSLHRWMDGKQGLVTYMQRAVGYSLTADVSEQIMFFLHGVGANGKSSFLGIIKECLGDYGLQAVSELLMAKNNDSHPTERADLFGKRFVCTIETDDGRRMAESLTKQLTGGDGIRARKMHKDFFDLPQTWKIWLAANHFPQVRGTDHAIWRRIKLVPFTVVIPENEKDKKLVDKLKAELPGILAWAVRGCLDWQREGLAEPEEVREATAKYRCEQDTVQQFLDQCCVINRDLKTRSGALLEAYLAWSGNKEMKQQTFKARLNEKGHRSDTGTGGYYYYHGVGLPAKEADSEDHRGGY